MTDPVRVATALTGDASLAQVRLEGARQAAKYLASAGQVMHVAGSLIGDGRVSGRSSRGNGDDALVGVAVLVLIAAELLGTSSELLSGSHHYAGAALLRQVVEVEYLTWAFAGDERDAASWLNSTRAERQSMFSPRGLRHLSDGRFRSEDYQHHCEQGGHPVPRGIPLLNLESHAAQMLMVDLLLHCWRVTDNVLSWAQRTTVDSSLCVDLHAAQQAFSRWSRRDPLYRWVLSASPPPGP